MLLKVFLIEDSPALSAHLTHMLTSKGNVDIVGVAQTESQAIAWLDRNAHQWDMALVDLFLEEGSGMGVIQHCHDRRPDQSVLVMTNHALDDALLHQCKLLGADAAFHKATELDKLVAYCTKLSASKPRRAAGIPAA